MYTKHLTRIILTTLCLFTTACSVQGADSDLKSPLNISFQGDNNELRAGEDLLVFLDNKTDECLAFPFDFNVKHVIYLDGVEIESSDLIEHLNKIELQINPKGELRDGTVLPIQPDLSILEIDHKVQAEAIITGYLCEDHDTVVTQSIPYFIVP